MDRSGLEQTVETPLRRRILVINNPAAGPRRRGRYEGVLRALRRWGCTLAVHTTERRGDAERIAALAAGYDAVAVAGGDGTLNEALNGLPPAPPPLAIIPLGTANLFALEIGLSFSPAAIARTIALAPPQPIRTGRINGRRFLLMAGIGFDAHLVAGLDPDLKRRLGKLAYGIEFFRCLRRFRSPGYGLAGARAASIIVSKGRYYAGPHRLAPGLKLGQARLVASLFERGGAIAALGYGAALLAGRIDAWPGVRQIEGEGFEIAGPAGEPVQLDGDIAPGVVLPAIVSLDPEPLMVLAPPRAAAG